MKILHRTEGLFRVQSVTDVTVVIYEDGVSNRVSTDRVTKMPSGPIGPAATILPPDRMTETLDNTAEYIVDRGASHPETPSGIQYKFRCHGYTATNDTWEPAEGPSPPFVDRY